MAHFVELGNKIAIYAKEQQMKSGPTSEDETTTDTTFDSDFESGEGIKSNFFALKNIIICLVCFFQDNTNINKK